MTKLIVFDKDGTLTEPISGGTFVQHPKDQKLRPGVAEKLEQLRSDGWLMAIASNQGGAEFDCEYSQLRRGMWIGLPLADGKTIEYYKITSSMPTDSGMGFKLSRPRWNGKDFYIAPKVGTIKARYKSIEEAADEMRFAMELTGIDTGFFCPDMAGGQCYWLDREKAGAPIECRNLGDSNAIDGLLCRKPDPGMLIVARNFQIWREEDLLEIDGVYSWKPGTCVMVGDRPEDQQAAEAAGFQFHWAKDFFEEPTDE